MRAYLNIGRSGISHGGFTLIELMVVIVIIGILAAIAGANYVRLQDNARMAACISQQRHVYEAAMAYAIDNTVPNGIMNVDVLDAAGYVTHNLCECPASPVEDFDDYVITWNGGVPTEVDCSVEGAEHDWQPR